MAKAKIKKKVVLELSEYEARTLCENEKEQDRICLRSFL